MAKKQNKVQKEETLETILFNCRNSLRGRAAMTDKRDLLLTLVFLKFIGERFKEQQEKIRRKFIEEDGITDEGFIEMQLKRPQHYLQDGVFKTYANPHLEIRQFPTGFTDYNFVFSVAG